MRSVVLGLALALGAGFGAEAAGCPVGRTLLVVQDTKSNYFMNEKLTRPDLVGKTFRVTRYVEKPDMRVSPRNGSLLNNGYEAYRLEGSAGTFIIKYEHIDGSPTTATWSVAPDDPKVKELDWTDPKPKRSVDLRKYGLLVNGGPLAALTLRQKACL